MNMKLLIYLYLIFTTLFNFIYGVRVIFVNPAGLQPHEQQSANILKAPKIHAGCTDGLITDAHGVCRRAV